MSGRLKDRIRHAIAAITFLSVLAAIGCGNYSPVAPSQDPPSLPGVANPQFVRVIPTSKGSDAEGSLAANKISAAEGGVISTGVFSVYFPPGALDEDTKISMKMPHDPYAVVRLEPHGIKFNKEVILSISADMIEPEASCKVLWYNEDSGYWEDIGGYYEDGYYKAGLEHFSEYGLTKH
ncbi:MAG: hypothetical protein JSV33_14245 [bacterium]|nr:MAG: hypothetical protein JSV33_14245 [bacterium]